MSDWLTELSAKIKKTTPIIFPEGESTAIIEAAYRSYQAEICQPYLLGDAAKIARICQELGIPTSGWWQAVDVDLEKEKIKGDAKLTALALNPDVLHFLLDDPLFFAAAYLRVGKVAAMVAGYNYTTGEVVSAGNMFLAKTTGTALASSYFVMDIPGYQGSEGELLLFADCGVNVEPTVKELAQIAIDTAQSAQILLDWEPRVALLSSSTKGSIDHESVEKVQQAFALIQEQAPNLKVDGELQGDAALNPKVAAKKVGGDSPVAGKANILVFPNLDAGNIAYKLTSQLANASAYGPLLQGLDYPLFDLSRGSSADEIYGVIRIAAVFANYGG